MAYLINGKITSFGIEKLATIFINSYKQPYSSSSFNTGFFLVKAARNPFARLKVPLVSLLVFFFIDLRF